MRICVSCGPVPGAAPWRAFYRRVGPNHFVIAAIGPEAGVNPKEFKRKTAAAVSRFAKLSKGG